MENMTILLLNALIDEIFPSKLNQILKFQMKIRIRENWTLSELINEVCNYIYDIVWHSLVKFTREN